MTFVFTQPKTYWDIFVSIMSAITPLILGFLGIYIAYQQWRTNHLKLKFDLFKERIAIYDAVLEFLFGVTVTNKVDDTKLFNFNRSTKNAAFYFNEGIGKYVRSIYDKAIELQGVQMSMKTLLPVDDTGEARQEESQMLKGLNQQILITKEKFKDFLILK